MYDDTKFLKNGRGGMFKNDKFLKKGVKEARIFLKNPVRAVWRRDREFFSIV